MCPWQLPTSRDSSFFLPQNVSRAKAADALLPPSLAGCLTCTYCSSSASSSADHAPFTSPLASFALWAPICCTSGEALLQDEPLNLRRLEGPFKLESAWRPHLALLYLNLNSSRSSMIGGACRQTLKLLNNALTRNLQSMIRLKESPGENIHRL
jgi:hypothetical protein